MIGDRLKSLREDKNLSQGDTEKRTGLLRCCVSHVENGHAIPAAETLEKFARALDMPMHVFFLRWRETARVESSGVREGLG